MKITMQINQKIGQPNYGSFGASASIEYEVDQATLKTPDMVLAQMRFAGDLARAAVDRELDMQRTRMPAPEHAQTPPGREPGSDDDEPRDDRDEGDRGYQGRNNNPPRRTDRERYDDRGGGRRPGGADGEPTSGKQLYGWANDRDELRWFSAFGKKRRYPARFNDWDRDEVADAMHEYYSQKSARSNGNGRR